MIFIDASALIAMIVGEEDADMLADLLAQERTRLVSPVAMWDRRGIGRGACPRRQMISRCSPASA